SMESNFGPDRVGRAARPSRKSVETLSASANDLRFSADGARRSVSKCDTCEGCSPVRLASCAWLSSLSSRAAFNRSPKDLLLDMAVDDSVYLIMTMAPTGLAPFFGGHYRRFRLYLHDAHSRPGLQALETSK